jgi:NADH-quinone oxidoreductase subunit L
LTPETLITLAQIILLLPLAGFVILVFIGKRLPRGGDWLETSFLFVCLALSFVILYEKLTAFPEAINWNFQWVSFGNVPGFGPLQIDLGMGIDNLAAIMMVVVCIVSSLTTSGIRDISRTWASSHFRCSSLS